jgi:hypothetical protein
MIPKDCKDPFNVRGTVEKSAFEPPRRSLVSRLIGGVVFAFAACAAVVIYLASTVVVAPVVTAGMQAFSSWVAAPPPPPRILSAAFLGERFALPCAAFDDVPAACEEDGAQPEVAFGETARLTFFGTLPALDPAPEKSLNTGAYFSLERLRSDTPQGEAVLASVREAMGVYGPFSERAAGGVLFVEPQAGSSARGGFYAVYGGAGGPVAASCFGQTCRVLQAPWRGAFAYSLTVQARRASELPAIDAAIRARLQSFAAP